jgi:3-phosphoshikimate 1-carboxyvinyltransferase
MERVAHPLRMMGADVRTEDGHPPVTIRGGPLTGIEYESPQPSAQVKSAVLLAGMQADEPTTVMEAVATRDHTERCLAALGAPIEALPGRVTISRFQHGGFRGRVPGDVSSAAFLAAAAAVVPGSQVVVRHVGLNSTRTAWIRHLERMGVAIEGHLEDEELGEPVGSLTVHAPDGLVPLELSPEETAEAIDEIPVLAAVAAHADGESRFTGAGELRVKESDRLAGVAEGIAALGGVARVEGDDLVVGGGGLGGGVVLDTQHDHRLVMAFAVAALGARGESVVDGSEWAAVSFPGFAETLAGLGADLEELDE